MTKSLHYRRATGQPAIAPRGTPRWVLLVLAFAVTFATAAVIAVEYFPDVLSTSLNLCWIIPILIPAAMLGLVFTAPLSNRKLFDGSPFPDLYRLLVSTALGLGAFALAMLALGTLHLLRFGPPALLIAATALGFFHTRTFIVRFNRAPFTALVDRSEWLLLLAAIPIATLWISTTFPPGTLWRTEARAYDVLAYHLELPREYTAANSTAPVAHNVYSYFPSIMEMLYTLILRLTQIGLSLPSHFFVAFPAQMLHAALTLLAGLGILLVPMQLSKLGRIVAMLAFLSTPWTLVIGSLAYNDAASLMFATFALGLVFCPRHFLMTLLIGIFLGLAVGCKMTSGVMLAVPIAGILLSQRRTLDVLKIAVFALAVYSPWAIRSMVYSANPPPAAKIGDPIFPIAAGRLGWGQDHWTDVQVARWNKGHSAKESERPLAARLAALVDQWFLHDQWSPNFASVHQWVQPTPPPATLNVPPAPEPPWYQRFGPLWIVFISATALAATRGPRAWQLQLMLAVQLVAWLYFTHLQSRFLWPAILPLALLLGLSVESFVSIRRAVMAAAALQCVLAAFLLLGDVGLFLGARRAENIHIGEIIRATNPGTKTLLVGEPIAFRYDGDVVYSTVFDRHPLAEILKNQGPEAAAAWIKSEHFNFVLVNFMEIDRLRRTYGFDPEITVASIEAMQHAGLPQPEMIGPGVILFELEK